MIKSLCIFILLFISFVTYGQESKLAQQYFKDGEYEKAAVLYKKLYEKNNRNDYYFRNYFKSLLNLAEYEEAEKAIKEVIKQKPDALHFLVNQGNLYEQQFQKDKAEKLYEKAIKKLDNNQSRIIQLANAFSQLAKYDYALKVYEKGVTLTKDESMFASNLANLYQRNGQQDKMIKYYLIYGKKSPSTIKYVKQVFQRQLSDSLSYYLKEELYSKMQEEPEEVMYVDILSWLFLQNKEYGKALRQLKSLDKRLGEDGSRVFELAKVCDKDKDYNTAIKAYRYIVEEKSQNAGYYLEARRKMLTSMRKLVDDNPDLPKEDLQTIQKGYQDALEELGKNSRTAQISIEYAEFEAYYLDNLEGAIEILAEVIGRTGVNDRIKASAKLDLGDYYLMTGEIWEGSLLYSQVDKSFQEGYLGEVARYKNAKLSYFNGDFEWSKIQLDVLKPSTSKLISNDAIDLSVFISENIGLDSTTIPLQMYADAELKALQNKNEQAFSRLDSIAFIYPDHELEDDIWYLRARIYADLKQYENAESFYLKVIEKHADNIRGDNAMFELAELYENKLNKKDKARELYEKIFIDHSNSTYAIEARKKYRELSDEEKFMQGLN